MLLKTSQLPLNLIFHQYDSFFLILLLIIPLHSPITSLVYSPSCLLNYSPSFEQIYKPFVLFDPVESLSIF